MWGSIGMMICLFIVGALIQGKSSFLLRLRILNIIMAYLLILCLMSFLQSSLSNSLCILLPILFHSSLLSLHLFLSISLPLPHSFSSSSSAPSLPGTDVTQVNTANSIAVFIMLFIVNFSYSYGPIAWLYPAEIFPIHLRAQGAY